VRPHRVPRPQTTGDQATLLDMRRIGTGQTSQVKIISFAYTTPALLAGAKTVTRREWNDDYAARFVADELIAAYDRSPRFKGKQVAIIQLTDRPRYEPNALMPPDDYAAEGFEWLAAHPEVLPRAAQNFPYAFSREGFDAWRTNGYSMWVVRFRLVEVVA
jgi:hypothetical protein